MALPGGLAEKVEVPGIWCLAVIDEPERDRLVAFCSWMAEARRVLTPVIGRSVAGAVAVMMVTVFFSAERGRFLLSSGRGSVAGVDVVGVFECS